MNVFRAAYCRIFQTVMKAAIPLLPYRQPQILHSAEDAAEILKDKNVKRALIITDAGVVKCGLTEDFKTCLENAGITYSVYDKTMPNPTVDAVEDARKTYTEDGCEALIAIGGGSAMDLAKGCGARIVRPKKSLNKMAGLLHVRKKLPPLFAIPTTAGTGSETTIAAVITDSATHRKYAINDFSLIPRYAVLDYKLTLGLPKTLTAYTGMDALTHAVEAFIGRSTTKDTRRKAVDAVKLIHDNLLICYDEPTNAEARKNMLLAAHYAGIAFTKSYVGYVHAVAHSLSGRYGLGHGLTNAVILPVMLEVYGKKVYKKLAYLARECSVAGKNDTDKVAAEKFISWIYSMNAYMQIPAGFEEIKDADIPEMAKYADMEGNPLYPVPVLMDRKQLEKIYYKVKK